MLYLPFPVFGLMGVALTLYIYENDIKSQY